MKLGQKIQENLVSVVPMKREQLRKAIALPARQVNLTLEQELSEQMLKDIEGSPLSLPLLEYTLTRLWEEESNWLERPQHKVRVSPFLMGKYPVTQAQWRAIASLSEVEHKLDLDPSYFKGDNRPVEMVSWDDAAEFCKRLARETGKDYRLPSEAKWEYACRAGTTTPYHFGNKIAPDLANYLQAGRGGTTPVGRFQVMNSFGLYDMHGQVFEWCEDNWHDDYGGAPTDGNAWITRGGSWGWIKRVGNQKVVRGGSWNSDPSYSRSAYRDFITRGSRFIAVGFRVVCEAHKTT